MAMAHSLFQVTTLLCLVAWTNSQVIPGLAVLSNVSYGSDPRQVMDVFLPGGRDATVSKVVVLIHGGGWTQGKKEDMMPFAYWFYATFPRHAIITMNYRLASVESPVYPKQTDDIALALKYVTEKQAEWQIKPEFGLVGVSAGGHLAMLYSYGTDKGRQVNVVCNVVGPTDITDPGYTNNSALMEVLKGLVGNETLESNPGIFGTVSPVSHVTRQSPKTIAFFGGKDPLIPSTQASRLEDKLDSSGVINKVVVYPNEGHAFSDPATLPDVRKRMKSFFKNYF